MDNAPKLPLLEPLLPTLGGKVGLQGSQGHPFLTLPRGVRRAGRGKANTA